MWCFSISPVRSKRLRAEQMHPEDQYMVVSRAFMLPQKTSSRKKDPSDKVWQEYLCYQAQQACEHDFKLGTVDKGCHTKKWRRGNTSQEAHTLPLCKWPACKPISSACTQHGKSEDLVHTPLQSYNFMGIRKWWWDSSREDGRSEAL